MIRYTDDRSVQKGGNGNDAWTVDSGAEDSHSRRTKDLVAEALGSEATRAMDALLRVLPGMWGAGGNDSGPLGREKGRGGGRPGVIAAFYEQRPSRPRRCGGRAGARFARRAWAHAVGAVVARVGV